MPTQQFPEIVVQTSLKLYSLKSYTVAYADLNKDGTQEILLQTQEGITYLQMDEDKNWTSYSYESSMKKQKPKRASFFQLTLTMTVTLISYPGNQVLKCIENNGDGKFTDVSVIKPL